MTDSNYPTLLTHKSLISVLGNIKEVRFSVDVMLISVRFHGISRGEFLKLLDAKFNRSNSGKERFTNSRAWGKLFKDRTYFDVGDSRTSMMALSRQARPLSNIHGMLVLNNPSISTVQRVNRLLSENDRRLSFALCGCELAFDFLVFDRHRLLELQRLIRLTSFFAYARVAFRRGTLPLATDYTNSRKSIKQLTVYQKNEDYECLRVEFDINRRKAIQQDLRTPRDLSGYRMKLLDELKFYRIDLERVERTLFDVNGSHYFSQQVELVLDRDGFQGALVWARSQRGCPGKCEYVNTGRCRHRIFARVNLTGKEMFELIQKCPHAKRFVNFRRDFCVEIPEFEEVQRMMKKSFKTWKR